MFLLQKFSLIYLCQGYPRLPPIEQTRLLPTILLSITSRAQHQNRLFCTSLCTSLDILVSLCILHVHVEVVFLSSYIYSILQLCIPALVHLEWPHDVKERRGLLPLSNQPVVRKLLLQFLLLYLLLPYGFLQNTYVCLSSLLSLQMFTCTLEYIHSHSYSYCDF